MALLALQWLRNKQGKVLLSPSGELQVAEYFCNDHGDVVHATVGIVREQYSNGTLAAWVICPEHGTQGIDWLPPLPNGFVLVNKRVQRRL